MIKKQREDQRHPEKHNQYALILRPQHKQAEEAENQYHKLRDDDVREDRTNKKPIFTLVK